MAYSRHTNLDPNLTLTTNSVNTCPYCSGLHDELGRMAQVTKAALTNPKPSPSSAAWPR